MKVVAEGVETAEQSEFLSANDCDEFQGFYFSKPMPSDELVTLLRNHTPRTHLSVIKSRGLA
jgi:EAL domain-containing protein (putative c-di-GMP-specific phosphodiesterase class I)